MSEAKENLRGFSRATPGAAKYILALPQEMKREIKATAAKLGITMNDYILEKLQSSLEGKGD